MGTAKDFNKVLHTQLTLHAGWLPVTNIFQVGDFGIISDGVFTRMGNIRDDFQVDFGTQPGDRMPLDFKSDRVREFRFTAGAEVTAFPDQGVEAKLKIEFRRGKSFYLKADLTSEHLDSVFRVAQQLVTKPDYRDGKFKVVSATYTGDGCVILSSRRGGTSIEIGGRADALKALELGKAKAGLTFKSTSELGLEIVGGNGVVGLRLFQVKKNGEVDFLRAEGLPGEEDLEITGSEDWGAELEDDI